jgi:tetratricopeptide (TPR) repeat protein
LISKINCITPKHHFHTEGKKGAQCVDCHMPSQNYMQVDARRDHSLRVPRPDLSMSLGSPNACTQCHAAHKPEWAATAMDGWYGKTWRDRPQFGQLFHEAASQGVEGVPAFVALAENTETPAIVRATAASYLQPYMQPNLLVTVRTLLRDDSPLVRMAALNLMEPADAINRALAATPLLKDPVLGVRIEAARLLADIPEYQNGTQEYVATLQQDADWPTSHVNLGNLYLRQSHLDAAIAQYEEALKLDNRFAGAYVNLADTYRQQENEIEAEKVLRRGLTLLPNVGDLHHALGLSLIRSGNKSEALKELAAALKFAPENERYAYVYKIALESIEDQ